MFSAFVNVLSYNNFQLYTTLPIIEYKSFNKESFKKFISSVDYKFILITHSALESWGIYLEPGYIFDNIKTQLWDKGFDSLNKYHFLLLFPGIRLSVLGIKFVFLGQYFAYQYFQKQAGLADSAKSVDPLSIFKMIFYSFSVCVGAFSYIIWTVIYNIIRYNFSLEGKKEDK